MASADDWCIKQFHPLSGILYRDVATGFNPCGAWTRVGYKTIVRSAAQDYGYPGENKDHRRIELEYANTVLQPIPSLLAVRIGYSAQAVESNDDNSGRCALVWRALKPKNIECQSERSGPDHVKTGTRPNKTMHWDFFFTGRYFYYELSVDGINGALCISRLSGDVKQSSRSAQS
jgi:hypothetical protein